MSSPAIARPLTRAIESTRLLSAFSADFNRRQIDAGQEHDHFKLSGIASRPPGHWIGMPLPMKPRWVAGQAAPLHPAQEWTDQPVPAYVIGLGEGQFHEIAQINSGVLDANTTLVTLSLGGNDEGAFTYAVTECAGLGDCTSDASYLSRYKAIIDRTKTRLSRVISMIHDKAPNAKIVLMSYPRVVQ